MDKRLRTQVEDNEITLLAYKDLMASFFSKHYPDVDPDKYWNWFLKELSQKNLDVNRLTSDELTQLLNDLQQVGNQLYDFNIRGRLA